MLAWLTAAATFVRATQASDTVENAGLLELVLRFVLDVTFTPFLSRGDLLYSFPSQRIACCQMLSGGMPFVIHCSQSNPCFL